MTKLKCWKKVRENKKGFVYRNGDKEIFTQSIGSYNKNWGIWTRNVDGSNMKSLDHDSDVKKSDVKKIINKYMKEHDKC